MTAAGAKRGAQAAGRGKMQPVGGGSSSGPSERGRLIRAGSEPAQSGRGNSDDGGRAFLDQTGEGFRKIAVGTGGETDG